MSKTRKPQRYAGFKAAAERPSPVQRKPVLPFEQAWEELQRRAAARKVKS